MSPFPVGAVATNSTIKCVLALCVTLVTSCASTATSAETDIRFMTPGVRVDPALPGQESIYVEFQDQTGQGAGFEDRVFEGIVAGVEARGYHYTSNYQEADYILWATLRLFGEAGTEEADSALVALGGMAGGLATVGAITAAGVDAPTKWWTTAADGGMTDAALSWALRENSWQMAVDLQLGKKQGSGDSLDPVPYTAGGSSGDGLVSGESRRAHRDVHFEMEQRIVAFASGTRLDQDVARKALVPKLIDGIKSALPRIGR